MFVIMPRTRLLPELNQLSNVEAEYKTQSTFDDKMIVKYLERIVISYKIRKGFEKILLIIDSAPCHLTKNVIGFCENNGILLSIIPPRMTNLLQPADVCWFATLKKAYKEKWNSWFI